MKIRQDLWGWIDIIGVHPSKPGVLGIQCTTGNNVSLRLAKAKGNAALLAWLLAGNPLVIHGWVKRKLRLAKGGWSKRGTWEVREIPVDRQMIIEGVA